MSATDDPPAVTFVPDAWMDEIAPPGRETPGHWLRQDGTIVPPDDWPELKTIAPAEGDLVRFGRLTNYGEVKLADVEDAANLPPAATHFTIAYDPETLSDSVKMLLEVIDEAGTEFPVIVCCFHWDFFDYRFCRLEGGVALEGPIFPTTEDA